MFAVHSIWLFTAVPWFHAFPVCCSGIFRMILRSFQLPLLLLASLLFLNSTSVTFLLQSLCISFIIFVFSELAMFIFQYHALWYVGYFSGWLSFFTIIIIIKGKAVPLQAWSGPEGSRKLRFPDFMTTAQDSGKVVSLYTGWDRTSDLPICSTAH